MMIADCPRATSGICYTENSSCYPYRKESAYLQLSVIKLPHRITTLSWLFIWARSYQLQDI